VVLGRPVVSSMVLAAALLGPGCGSEQPSADEEQEQEQERLVAELAEDLQAETGGTLDGEASRCVAEGLVDAVGLERFEEVVAAAAADEDSELRMQVIDVFASCDALEPLIDAP
jgi:hypothetical protein